METGSLIIPRPPAKARFRPPKANLPQTPQERNRVLHFVRNYVAEFNPVPPLPVKELREHAERVVGMLKCEPVYVDYIGILINNEMWRESLASIPYERRLLLLPKCLRIESKCPAPFDEFGLLCKQCGLCSIQDLQNEAERLGYAVLVAEGSAIVMSLIQTGKIEAIVGVSCISVLERAFPYMEAAAIPGVAVPLLQDDCIDTTVDLDWIWDYLHLTSDDKTRRLDLGALRHQVDQWFTETTLGAIMGPAEGATEALARQWLARAGKRWRPFLTISTFQALRRHPERPLPEDIRKIAVAVECFHKASLIHDDIEDGDSQRYGQKTLHEEVGMPAALNVGDFLIGEGYRMIAQSEISAELKAQMLETASAGQRQLCQGQGAELLWTRRPGPLTSRQVIEIFRQKTAPAFEVALRLGAIYADELESVSGVLSQYSEALGIAYQIRDDLDDTKSPGDSNDITAMRPNLPLAFASEKAKGEQKSLLEAYWQRQPVGSKQVVDLVSDLQGAQKAATLLEAYKEEAIRSLREIDNPNLKGLLRRVIGRIFNDTEIKGWCGEFEEKNLAKDSH